MKAVQIVLDEKLLAEVDRAVRKRGSSRSAFIRESVTQTLGDLRMQELIEAERRAYKEHPQTADELATFRALAGAQEKAMAVLTKRDRW